MKTLCCTRRRHFLCVSLSVAAMVASCGGRRDVPDSTTTGMQGGAAPTGRENYGQSSGQEAVPPQNLGPPSTAPEKKAP